jgi:hypothetical protein
MLQATNFGCLLVALWGVIGIWTTKVGYHNLWEFWFFNAQFGFSMGAQFSYGQAFMAELVPRGREYMFFSLLGIVSKGSGKSAGKLGLLSRRPPHHLTPSPIRSSLTSHLYSVDRPHRLFCNRRPHRQPMDSFSLRSRSDIYPVGRDLLHQRSQEQEGVC